MEAIPLLGQGHGATVTSVVISMIMEFNGCRGVKDMIIDGYHGPRITWSATKWNTNISGLSRGEKDHES